MTDTNSPATMTSPEEPPSSPAPQSLAVRAAGSSIWTLFGQILQVFLGIASFGLLSRWLTPADYGLLGMAATVSGFLGVVGDSGITNAVIRLSTIDAEAEATAFWLSLFGAIILTTVAAVSAPLLAWLYHDPSIVPVSLVLASTFLLGAPVRAATAKMSRSLRFRALTTIGLVSTACSLGLAVILAVGGFGVWALVAQGISSIVIQTLLTVFASPLVVRPSLFSRSRARELAGVGSRLSGFSLAITIGRSLDTVLAGRILGSSALGFMSMGMKLVVMPVERLCGAFYSVFLPATVELKDLDRQARAFTSALRLLLIVVGPFCLGAVAIAPEIIALLPPKWLGLAPVLRLYAMTALLMPIGYLSMSVLVAHGLASSLFRTAVILIPISWIGAILGARSGSVLGMVAAWSFSIAAGGAAFLWLVSKQIRLGREFWTRLTAPMVTSSVMAIATFAVVHLAHIGGTRRGFVVGALVGAAIYAALAWLGMRADLVRTAQLLRQSMVRKTLSSPQ